MSLAPVFFMLSERFGWTPGQIMAMSIRQLQAYLNQFSAKSKVKSGKAVDLFIAQHPRA
jgi:hypothetical protein